MKKILKISGIVIVSVLLLAAGLVALFPKKAISYVVPEIKGIEEMNLQVRNDTAYMDSKISARNKSFFRLQIDSIKYSITLFDKVNINDHRFVNLVLGPYETDTFTFTPKLPFKQIFKHTHQQSLLDSTPYAIKLVLQYSTIFGKVNLPIEKKGKIKLPRFPDIKISKVRYKRIKNKLIQADVAVQIINQNDFNIVISEISYHMILVKRATAKGNHRNPITIRANTSTNVNLPVRIDLKKKGRTLLEVLTDTDTYPYVLNMVAFVRMPSMIKNGEEQSFHIDLLKEGEMELVQ